MIQPLVSLITMRSAEKTEESLRGISLFGVDTKQSSAVGTIHVLPPAIRESPPYKRLLSDNITSVVY